MKTRKGSRSTRGTDLKVGDKLVGFDKTIAKVTPGTHPMGAKYLDVVFTDDSECCCWEGFQYHVECEIVLTLENATSSELAEME